MLIFTSVSHTFSTVDPAFNIYRLFLFAQSTRLRLFSIEYVRENTTKNCQSERTFRGVFFVKTQENLENRFFVDVVVYFYVFKFFLAHVFVTFHRFSSYPGKNKKNTNNSPTGK